MAVDATGVGAPVVDMLRAAGWRCDLTSVIITGGERGAGKWTVPKRDLIAGLQVLLERGQLKSGKLRETGQLMRELMNMRIAGSEWPGEARGGWVRGTRRSGDRAGAGRAGGRNGDK